MGFAETMISSLKNNRRPKRPGLGYEEVEKNPSENWKKALEQKATPKQLEEIRSKSAEESVKTRYKKRMAFILTLLIVGLLFSLLSFFL